MKGFRPGKAPLKVIRQQFGTQIHREVIGELLQSSYAEAVTQNQLTPAGNPRIEPQSMDEGQDLKYAATFEVFPGSRSAADGFARSRPGDGRSYRKRHRRHDRAAAQTADEIFGVNRGAATGDKVTIDFEGTIDGVAFAGGKGENIALVLGEGRMLPELEQGLIGADGRARSAISTVNFPSDYRAAELAGKTAIFATEIKTVEEPVLPEIDEEFCKAFGVTEGGLSKLREDVAANMRRELEQALRNRNKAAVMEKLYAANPTEVPNVLIEGQIRDMQVEAMRRAGTKDAAQAPPREPFIEPARRRVALGLLLNDVIRKENLVVDRARVNERLDEMVSAYGDAGAMKRAYMQNAEAMRQVESLALEDQVVEWVLDHAKVQNEVHFQTIDELRGLSAHRT